MIDRSLPPAVCSLQLHLLFVGRMQCILLHACSANCKPTDTAIERRDVLTPERLVGGDSFKSQLCLVFF
jgi:hypothetical protein